MRIHQEIYERILADFAGATAVEGDKLPSIKRLAERYKVSETPVRQAVQKLIEDNIIKSVRRSGLFLLKSHCPQTTHIMNEHALPFHSHSRKNQLTISLFDNTPKQREMWLRLIDHFQRQHPTVEVVPKFGNATNWSDEDIVQLGARDLFDFISSGKAQELPQELFPFEKIPKTTRSSSVMNNRIYSVPLNVLMPYLMINKGIMKQLGITITPDHFQIEDFTKACERLEHTQERQEIPNGVMPLCSQVNPFLYLHAFSRKFIHGEYFDWKSKVVLEFFNLMRHVQRPPREISMSWSELKDLFYRGEALFFSGCDTTMEKIIPDDAIVLPFPCDPEGSIIHGANGHVINIWSSNKTAAIKFLQFFGTEEAITIVKSCGALHVSSLEPAADDPVSVAEFKTFRNSTNCMDYGADNYDFIVDCFFPVIDHLREGLVTPEEAANHLHKQNKQTLTA